jgi:hypothetical protein
VHGDLGGLLERQSAAAVGGRDTGLGHLLDAFISETDSSLLCRIAEGTEVSWTKFFWHLAEATQKPGDLFNVLVEGAGEGRGRQRRATYCRSRE